MHRQSNKEFSEQKLILGTHTSDAEQNYLMIAKVHLPIEDANIDPRKYDDQKGGNIQQISLLNFFFFANFIYLFIF